MKKIYGVTVPLNEAMVKIKETLEILSSVKGRTLDYTRDVHCNVNQVWFEVIGNLETVTRAMYPLLAHLTNVDNPGYTLYSFEIIQGDSDRQLMAGKIALHFDHSGLYSYAMKQVNRLNDSVKVEVIDHLPDHYVNLANTLKSLFDTIKVKYAPFAQLDQDTSRYYLELEYSEHNWDVLCDIERLFSICGFTNLKADHDSNTILLTHKFPSNAIKVGFFEYCISRWHPNPLRNLMGSK